MNNILKSSNSTAGSRLLLASTHLSSHIFSLPPQTSKASTKSTDESSSFLVSTFNSLSDTNNLLLVFFKIENGICLKPSEKISNIDPSIFMYTYESWSRASTCVRSTFVRFFGRHVKWISYFLKVIVDFEYNTSICFVSMRISLLKNGSYIMYILMVIQFVYSCVVSLHVSRALGRHFKTCPASNSGTNMHRFGICSDHRHRMGRILGSNLATAIHPNSTWREFSFANRRVRRWMRC